MSISRITALMIQTNEIEVIDTANGAEAWVVKNGSYHSLLLSCPHDRRQDMERIIAELKAEAPNKEASQP